MNRNGAILFLLWNTRVCVCVCVHEHVGTLNINALIPPYHKQGDHAVIVLLLDSF